MKITVQRVLRGGLYHVSFKVADFTDEERGKMEGFGVPAIALQLGGPGNRRQLRQPLTAINEKYTASFATELEAKKYEEEVLNQVRERLESLRGRKDTFTSTEEVNI